MAAAGAPIRVPVAVACRVLGLSTQGYYKWLKSPVCQRDWDDAHVIDVLRAIHEDDATLGYRFLTDELADAGIKASENRVWRLCGLAGVFASHHRRRGKSGKPGPAVHDDLLATVDDNGRVSHDFTGAASGPNQVWLTDISEHPTREGKLYLCAGSLKPPRVFGQDRGLLDRLTHEIRTRRRRVAQRDRVAVTSRHDRPFRPRQSISFEKSRASAEEQRPARVDGAGPVVRR